MRKTRAHFLFFLFLVLVSSGVGWAQGVITLPQTGQTRCYNASGGSIACPGTGQDGEWQMGVEWPEPRFTVSGDCVADNLTGLIWAKDGNLPNGTRTWQGALDYVASLNSGTGLCGYKDWRLPNINELESLFNAGEANIATWLNSEGFSNVQYNYWSSTTYAISGNYAWYFDAFFGAVNGYSESSYACSVWPVRSGQLNTPDSFFPANIWKTGQTSSYATGDDGDLERGVSWPTPRFTDHGNGTITDNLTGLVWSKNANLPGGSMVWVNALDYVKALNAEAGLGGYHDWRLPNRKEIFSLIDHSGYTPALPTGHPFQNVQGGYWSSTAWVFLNFYSWVVYMWDGHVGYDYWSGFYYVWPVRSGPDISVTPNPVPFGSVNVGVALDQTITVKNDGNANLVIGSITNPEAPFSKQTDNCSGQSIPPSGTCTVTYRFAPTSGGTFSGNSNIPSNDPDEDPKTIILTGTGCPTPGTPSGPTPSDSATGISTSPTLTWGATSNTDSYDVYWGTSTNPPLAGNVTYHSYSLYGLSPNTLYYWRIAAKNNCGNATSGPTWSFTTCPTPGIPLGPSPPDTTTGVSANPILSWAATSNTDSYDVYWGTSMTPPLIGNVTSTSYPLSGLNLGTVYHWKVVAKNNCGNSTSGSVWSFTTLCPTTGTPSGPTPLDSATGISTSPTLTWGATSNTDSYDVYLGTSITPPLVGNVTSTSYPLSGLNPGTVYHWKVVAKNNCGNSTSGSVWSFTTLCPTPGTPSGPSPSNGASGIPTTITLTWASTSNTDSYDIYFGTSSDPPMAINVTGTSHPVSGLNTNTTYYWKIVSKNSCGNSTSGSTWSFTTICPTPGAFSNLSPPNGATNQSRDVDLAWGDASGVVSYDVYFGTLNPPPFATNRTTSSYDPGTLGYGTSYFWKVVAKNGCGDTAGSIWGFTTIACPTPGTPSNPSPSHNTTGVSINPTLSWGATSDTDSYDVYFGTSTNPPKVGNVTSNSYPLSGLSANTTYYWKVVAKNNCENSTSGPVLWSFTTCPMPGTPSAPSPSDGATGIPMSPTLIWAATANTDSYDVYFGTPIPALVGNVTSTSYPLSGLNPGTVYHWKVVAKNNCGNSTAGTVWSFVTRSLEITPEEGTIGTTVTIKGDNFGATKGTVFIGSVALKSSGWGSSEIQASLSKSFFPGTYSVTVKPKKKGIPPITESNLFTVWGPEIDSGGPNSGAPGTTITLSGMFFGNKKGKVLLEYESKGVTKLKSCKVLSWEMYPKTGEGEVVFVVPKGLAPGTYPLHLSNSVGEDTAEFTIIP